MLPPEERRAFRKFLFSLDGAEPKRKRIHSWKRKARKIPAIAKEKKPRQPRRRPPDAQIPLPFD